MNVSNQPKEYRDYQEVKKCSQTDCMHKGVLQPLDHFQRRHTADDGRMGTCKTCTTARDRARNKPEARRESHYKRTYGMTIADYDRMVVEQDGKCAICETTTNLGRYGRFHIDHDHKTGKVRGLLCHRCNRGIGLLKDDPAILDAAACYLEDWS